MTLKISEEECKFFKIKKFFLYQHKLCSPPNKDRKNTVGENELSGKQTDYKFEETIPVFI